MTDRDILERLANPKMTERHLKVLLQVCDDADDAIGICQLYAEVNAEFFYGGEVQGWIPIEEAELRRILQWLRRNDWIERRGLEYALSEGARALIGEAKPQMEWDAARRAKQEELERAKRRAKNAVRIKKRQVDKLERWMRARQRQGGRCCVCSAELPASPPPSLRTIPEGDFIPCESCYSSVTCRYSRDSLSGIRVLEQMSQ